MAIAMAVSFFLAFGGLTEKAAHLSGDRPAEHLPRVAELLVAAENRGSFVPRVNHTIFATRIATAAVFFPGRLLDDVFAVDVMRVRHQVARPLQAAWVDRG